ncbi:MAG: 4Fe-4S binding protein [Syntrophaceae bacterium]|jgi:NAD-dependent dihydropyrimidine dehydrogenase PreA subunit|nr:4Fe-4S binding protein [Syntrophaceae bacterium]
MNTGVPEIDPAKCTGCGECIEECPTQAVELLEGKAVIARPDDCCYCTNCESLCPEEAIRCPFEIILAE